MKKACFAAGCFWGVEETFSSLAGVLETSVGYTGGHSPAPTYQEVCTGSTGHAEAILIEYDESSIDYIKLLDVFWECHNPTQLNRQGVDIGTQYRSAIFFFDEQQKNQAQKSLSLKQESIDQKIVTQIEEMKEFFPAEEYHQKYFKKNPGSCSI